MVALSKESLMGRFVIVAYTPKAGMEPQLLAAVRKHLQVLRAERLVTDRPASVMRAGDGTIVEGQPGSSGALGGVRRRV
jgi:hypothetical protein